MKDNLEHLLSKHGVLTSFSIAKKVNEDNIKELTDKIKGEAKNKFDFHQKLKNEISKQSIDDILNNKVPGLIKNKDVIPEEEPTVPDIIPDRVEDKVPPKKKKPSKKMEYKTDKAKMAVLYTLISKISGEVIHNNLTKNDICFMIYAVLNFLEVTEEDFATFHKEARKKDEPLDDNDDTDEFFGNDDTKL